MQPQHHISMKRERVDSVEGNNNGKQDDVRSSTSSDDPGHNIVMSTKNDLHYDDNASKIIHQHLDWSDKQRRILTACGNADQYYTSERGFSYEINELPHHYLQFQFMSLSSQQQEEEAYSISPSKDYNSTYEAFQKWKVADDENYDSKIKATPVSGVENQMINKLHRHNIIPIVGIWKRPLFIGNFEHTTDQNGDEIVYNIQSNTLFIDLRIPIYTRNYLFDVQSKTKIQSIDDLNIEQLRYYSRQHIFAGYTRYYETNSNKGDKAIHITSEIASDVDDPITTNYEMNHKIKKYDQYCTRHHCIDWNYVGIGRTRPNKWWVEFPEETNNEIKKDCWKEYSYSTDHYGQYYYMERWEKLLSDNLNSNGNNNESDVTLVLRMKQIDGIDRDGIIILVNNHFNYCIWNGVKQLINEKQNHNVYNSITSKVNLIDTAIEQNDIITAKKWLRCIQGGHGYRLDHHNHENISASSDNDQQQQPPELKAGWILDTCIEFWKEGTKLWNNDEIQINHHETSVSSIHDCIILWNNIEWKIFDYQNINSIQQLHQIIYCSSSYSNNYTTHSRM